MLKTTDLTVARTYAPTISLGFEITPIRNMSATAITVKSNAQKRSPMDLRILPALLHFSSTRLPPPPAQRMAIPSQTSNLGILEGYESSLPSMPCKL